MAKKRKTTRRRRRTTTSTAARRAPRRRRRSTTATRRRRSTTRRSKAFLGLDGRTLEHAGGIVTGLIGSNMGAAYATRLPHPIGSWASSPNGQTVAKVAIGVLGGAMVGKVMRNKKLGQTIAVAGISAGAIDLVGRFAGGGFSGLGLGQAIDPGRINLLEASSDELGNAEYGYGNDGSMGMAWDLRNAGNAGPLALAGYALN